MLQRQKDNIKILSTDRLIISGFQPCNQVCDINNVVSSIFIVIIFDVDIVHFQGYLN